MIGLFAKAGFKIELEDETDSTRSHCELTATHTETGKKFSVEAKAVSSASLRSGISSAPPKIRGKLYDALSKQADHTRIIFIELSRSERLKRGEIPAWVPQIDDELGQAEKDLLIEGAPAPPAYVFVTNRPFVHALTEEAEGEAGVSCGFKIDDFSSRSGAKSVLELVHVRKRHKEMHWLRNAVKNHTAIPSTFDDRLPEELTEDKGVPRLLIGNTYLVPTENGEEKTAILTEAIVLLEKREVAGVYRLENGSHILCNSSLTEKELDMYRRSPETFFGIVKDVNHEINDPLEAFDFAWGTYQKTDRNRLLEFMADWPDIEALKKLDQLELAEIYCARIAEWMWSHKLRDQPRVNVKPPAPSPSARP